MAGPHFKKKLIHRAVVQRSTPTRTASGEWVDAWSAVGTIDCRYVQRTDRFADEALGWTMLKSHLLLCNAGEDVEEDDRITSITFKVDGTSVDAGPFDIEGKLERNAGGAHHISLNLERVE